MQAALRSKALLKELYEILVEDKSDKLTPPILVLADLRKFLVDLPSKRLLDKDIKPCIEASNPAGTIESLDQFQAIMNNIVKANTDITSTDEIVFSFLVAPCRRYSLKSQHLEKTNIHPPKICRRSFLVLRYLWQQSLRGRIQYRDRRSDHELP